MTSLPPPKPTSHNPLNHLRVSDLRGVAQLATQATAGVTRIAEGVHQSVWRTLGARGGKTPEQTGGITGLVYQSIHGVTQLVGKTVGLALTGLQPWLESLETKDGPAAMPQREAVLAALNGVLGDRLAEGENPLATPMTFRVGGVALNWQALPTDFNFTAKLVLLVHGLCMNDLQWRTTQGKEGDQAHHHDHGQALAAALGYTAVYLRYNTGLHTSQNGHSLSAQLEQLVAHWPVPLDEITVVAHSMGGLVTRSAVQSAKEVGTTLHWPKLLKNIVFLGTPHHGAPLERAGNWLDVLLGATPYSKPFTKLVQLRSAGITDLRYGHVADADWAGKDRFRKQPDSRHLVPLPEGVACFTVAATTAAQRSAIADRLIGDGLVPLRSALGLHDEAARTLVFAKASQRIIYRMNHMQLLSSPEVTAQLVRWLAPEAA